MDLRGEFAQHSSNSHMHTDMCVRSVWIAVENKLILKNKQRPKWIHFQREEVISEISGCCAQLPRVPLTHPEHPAPVPQGPPQPAGPPSLPRPWKNVPWAGTHLARPTMHEPGRRAPRGNSHTVWTAAHQPATLLPSPSQPALPSLSWGDQAAPKLICTRLMSWETRLHTGNVHQAYWRFSKTLKKTHTHIKTWTA